VVFLPKIIKTSPQEVHIFKTRVTVSTYGRTDIAIP